MSVWSARRARALSLRAEAPHAEEILACYAGLTEVQERVAARVPVERWRAVAREPEGSEPLLALARLPLDELSALFDEMLRRGRGLGTAVMTAEAARLIELIDAGSDEHRRLLAGALLDVPAGDAGPPFHVRAFLEAIATTLAAGLSPPTRDPETEETNGGRCPSCGGRPVVATLRDLPGALGTRSLVCGRCGTETRIRRLTCAHCGERAPERLGVHTAESVRHVRLDECRSCRRYIKTVDLRQRGDAVPLVDDLATVELDLWAREQGLTKIHANVFGL